ncbi:hypothetical protein ABZ234_11350 [Nocardiopsis sp. NPDC006198]|uniref:hypothetical protein n=1 Tax=Nocardiopsis sp. NPDC006198 TaxID=3154472 RepID=UPI0033AE5A43
MNDRTTSPLTARRAVAEQRARDIAAAWQRGDRDIRALAARHSVGRDTVHADLRAAGIDPTDRTAPVDEPRMITTAELDRAQQAFARDSAGFTMDVRMDNAGYRHLHFEQGKSWWDLHAFPGGLMVRGDHGAFVFANGSPDIFSSFRFSGVDPAYWAQTLDAGTARSWSEQRFRDWLTEEAESLGVLERARKVLSENNGYDLEHEASARWALANAYDELGIAFPDPGEVDLYDWDEYYLWTVHAISAGIRAYDQAATETTTP